MRFTHNKPVIVLDDELGFYEAKLTELGFIIIFLKDRKNSSTYPSGISGILDETEKLEMIFSGRTFLTASPGSLEARQLELNFDMIVVSSEADIDTMTKIMVDEIQHRSLGDIQACWRLDISPDSTVQFEKLEDD